MEYRVARDGSEGIIGCFCEWMWRRGEQVRAGRCRKRQREMRTISTKDVGTDDGALTFTLLQSD